jgi:hypothetical protein
MRRRCLGFRNIALWRFDLARHNLHLRIGHARVRLLAAGARPTTLGRRPWWTENEQCCSDSQMETSFHTALDERTSRQKSVSLVRCSTRTLSTFCVSPHEMRSRAQSLFLALMALAGQSSGRSGLWRSRVLDGGEATFLCTGASNYFTIRLNNVSALLPRHRPLDA